MKKLLLALCFFIGLQHAALAASCSSYPFTLQNNTTADATQVMADFNTVRNCVINNAAGSGVNTDITSLTGLTTPLTVPQGGTPVFVGGTSTGSANVQIVATTIPIGFSLTNGYRVTFIAGFSSTSTVTLNVNGTGATAVKKLGFGGLETLTYGEIVAGNVVEAVYDGTQFVLLSALVPPFGAAQSVTATTTTDIGIYNTHNVVINGTTSITALGVTASVSQPVYNLKFGGALTLTYNATSLIIPGAGNIITATNDTAVAEFLGSGNWRINSYTRASGAGIVSITPLCGANEWTVVNNTAVPTAKADYSAATAVMITTAGVPITASSVSGTIDATTTGANGLDVGVLGTSSWYYLYLINNGTVTAGLASLSSTAPTMPSGYIYKCRLGAYITDASNLFRKVRLRGREGQYTTVQRNIANGVIGTWSATAPVWSSAVVVANVHVPATATAISIIMTNKYNNNTVSDLILAPNNSYTGSQSLFPPPCAIEQTASHTQTCPMLLESTGIFWASDATGGGINALGWTDNVNAN